MKKFGLFAKLVLTVSGLMIFLTVILSLFFINHEKSVIREELKERGLSLANNLAYNCEYGVLTDNAAELSRLLKGVMVQSDVSYCIIRQATGKVLVSSKDSPNGIDSREIKEANTLIWSLYSSTKHVQENYYDISVPVETKASDETSNDDIFSQNQSVHKLIGSVELGLSWARIDILIKKVQRAVFTMVLIMLFITVSVIFWFGRLLLAPVEALVEATRKISAGDLDFKVAVKTHDEIGVLADSFNKMVDDLQKITVSRDELVHENIARKRAEEAMLRSKEDAEAANRAKSEFLANMSHEIRTPLNAILGFSDLLRSITVDEQQRTYLNTITTSSDILIAVINDILDFSKLEAGKVPLENIDFDLGNLVNDIFNMAKIKFKGLDINPFIDWDTQVPQWVKGDPTRIRQILLNFLNNSAKFTHQGEIGVIVRLEQITPQGPVINFCVKDSGIGIPQDKKNKLFSSFSQVDSSTTRRYGGTGLGLAISKKLVEAMGGKVWFESEEGFGSKFFFTIPFGVGASLVQQAIDPLTKAQLVNKLVLCVDDHPASLEIVSRYCKEMGLRVIQAVNAAQVLKELDKRLAAKDLPDLILSDVRMPDMDGYMLVEKIRSQAVFDSIKIVATTSDARVGGALLAQEKGFNAYLPKPVIRNDLNKVISAVLGDRRPVSAPIITRHVAAEVGLKGVKVLVVDDVVSNQQLMKAYLGMFGCISDIAANGQEAIDKIKSDTYDICLMDVQMPVLDGIEATKIIRAQISKDLPVIALTAAVMKEDIEKALSAGMNDFLTKPLEINILKTKLLKFVSSSGMNP